MAQYFSRELEDWLQSHRDKSLGGLIKLFGERSFAVIFLVLMALPALPLPTAGITHVTELITTFASLQMIIGRQTLWLPKRWLRIKASKTARPLLKTIRWFERFSRPRAAALLRRQPATTLIGLLILVLTVAAFVAPPFSGLDTLPALGVVIISLGLILEDILLVILGVVVGAVGIGLELAAGTALYAGLKHFL